MIFNLTSIEISEDKLLISSGFRGCQMLKFIAVISGLPNVADHAGLYPPRRASGLLCLN
jgi:hypothetical protein